MGRVATAIFVVAGCLMAPLPGSFEGVFQYIQMIWGFISPGIVAVFIFGLIFRRAPLSAALAAMILGIPVYGVLLWLLPEVAFLNHMAVTFIILVAVMGILTLVKPLPQPVRFTTQSSIDLTPSPLANTLGWIVIVLTILLYIVFW